MFNVDVSQLFKNKTILKNAELKSGDKISLDFAQVDEIKLNDLEALLNIQKIAILNENDFDLVNLKPTVYKTLEQTGIYRTFNPKMSNPIKFNKRLGLN